MIVILNARAGTLRDLGPQEVRRRVAAPLEASGRTVEVVLATGKAIGAALRAALEAGHDEIVLGGGDGTISRAVGPIAAAGRTLGVLPLGTMNLFARDLGMPADLDAALEALATAEPRTVDLATLNDRLFHSLSGLGFFSQIARAREETQRMSVSRFTRFGISAWRAFTRTGRLRFYLEIDGSGQVVETYAFVVTVNAFDAPGLRRSRLDGGQLEVHVAQDAQAFGRLRAAADLMFGTWRDNAAISSYLGRRVVLSRERPRAWVSTDGEIVREHVPLIYEIRPRAIQVLTPVPKPEPA